MAVPYEPPIETLDDVVQRTDRAHFCGSTESTIEALTDTNLFLEGTYEVFFTTSTNPVVNQVYEMAKQEKYGLVLLLFINSFSNNLI